MSGKENPVSMDGKTLSLSSTSSNEFIKWCEWAQVFSDNLKGSWLTGDERMIVCEIIFLTMKEERNGL